MRSAGSWKRHRLVGVHALPGDRDSESRFDPSDSRARNRDMHPNLNCCGKDRRLTQRYLFGNLWY